MKTQEQLKDLMDKLDAEIDLITKSSVPVLSEKAEAIQEQLSNLLRELHPGVTDIIDAEYNNGHNMKTPEQLKALQDLGDELDTEMNLIDKSPVPVTTEKVQSLTELVDNIRKEFPWVSQGCCGSCSGKCGK